MRALADGSADLRRYTVCYKNVVWCANVPHVYFSRMLEL